MEPESVLKDMGLTDTETKIYFAVLKLGQSDVGEIVKKTGLYKANIYDALDRLEKKGLVSHLKKENKLFYSSSNPRMFFEMIDVKKENLNSIFPILEKFYNAKKTKREVNIFSGVEGMKMLFNDMYETKKEICSIGSSLQMHSVMKHRLVQFLGKLKKEKIPLRLIVADKEDIRKQMKYFYKSFENTQFRFYPEKFISPVAFAAYGNRFSLIVWEDEPLIILIKDENISMAFKNYFEMIWGISKK